MEVRPRDLEAHLKRTLAPLYVLHGAETLLVLEAADTIRAAARQQGFDEREVLIVEAGFEWERLNAGSRNLSLFGGRRLIDLRIPNGKPGVNGAAALIAHAQATSADVMTLVTLPKLERAAMASEWFVALEENGVAIQFHEIERAHLPGWIAQRLARQNQKASIEVLEFLADRFEGNLVAAKQEIDKLALLCETGELDLAQVEEAVAHHARFGIEALSEALLGLDPARYSRVVRGLSAAGEAPPLVLWQLSEDVRALVAATGSESGSGPPRIWGKRKILLERALPRMRGARLREVAARLGQLDELSKGIGEGEFWLEAERFGLEVIDQLVTRKRAANSPIRRT